MTDHDPTPRDVLATLNERVIMPRVGLSIMREMDRDILAMRDAARVISLLTDPEHLASILSDMDEFECLGTVAATENAAQSLADYLRHTLPEEPPAPPASGTRFRREGYEYVHYAPEWTDPRPLNPLPIVRVTHRRRAAGPWEPVPLDEAFIADVIVTGSLP